METGSTPTSTAPGASAPAAQDAINQITANESKNQTDPNEDAVKNVAKKFTKPEPKKEVAEESKPKRKLFKIDGSEYEVDEKTYEDAARISLTANKRMHEATTLQKKAVEELKKAQELQEKYSKFEKSAPDQLIEEMLTKLEDPQTTQAARDRIEKWLVKQIEMEQQSPEQRAMTAAEKRAQAAEAKLKEIEDGKKKEARTKELQVHQKTAQERIISIAQKSGLPVTEKNFKFIADLLYNDHKAKAGSTDEQLANILKSDTIETSTAIYGQIADGIIKAKESGDQESILKNGQALLDYMPESILKALRIYDYTKHVSGVPAGVPKQVLDTPKTEAKTGTEGAYQFKNMDEFQEYRRKQAQELQKSWKKV